MDQSPNSLKFGFGLEYSFVKKYLKIIKFDYSGKYFLAKP